MTESQSNLIHWHTALNQRPEQRWMLHRRRTKTQTWNNGRTMHSLQWIPSQRHRTNFSTETKEKVLVENEATRRRTAETCSQISLCTGSNSTSRDPQQHCSRFNQIAGAQTPVRQWLIHFAPMSTKPATRPKRHETKRCFLCREMFHRSHLRICPPEERKSIHSKCRIRNGIDVANSSVLELVNCDVEFDFASDLWANRSFENRRSAYWPNRRPSLHLNETTTTIIRNSWWFFSSTDYVGARGDCFENQYRSCLRQCHDDSDWKKKKRWWWLVQQTDWWEGKVDRLQIERSSIISCFLVGTGKIIEQHLNFFPRAMINMHSGTAAAANVCFFFDRSLPDASESIQRKPDDNHLVLTSLFEANEQHTTRAWAMTYWTLSAQYCIHDSYRNRPKDISFRS